MMSFHPEPVAIDETITAAKKKRSRSLQCHLTYLRASRDKRRHAYDGVNKHDHEE